MLLIHAARQGVVSERHCCTHIWFIISLPQQLKEIATAQLDDVTSIVHVPMDISCEWTSLKEACAKLAVTQNDMVKLAPTGDSSSLLSKIRYPCGSFHKDSINTGDFDVGHRHEYILI